MRMVFVISAAIVLATQSPGFAQVNAALSPANVVGVSTWKTISLGSFASTWALFDALDTAGVHIGDTAEEILHRPAFTVSKVKTRLQLVILAAADLGFGEHVSLAAFYARAQQLGYELCTPEVVVQLRLQYRDQPVGEFLNIAMDPMATFDGQLTGLSVANGGAGLMIVGEPLSLDSVRDRSARFVFVRPQQIARPVPLTNTRATTEGDQR